MLRSRDALDEQMPLIRLAIRADVAPEGPGQGRAATEYAVAVRHLLDEHSHVRAHLPAALAALPRRDQHFLRLRVGRGHTCYAVRAALGLGTRISVDARADALLVRLAGLLWDDAGRPPVPAAGPARSLAAVR